MTSDETALVLAALATVAGVVVVFWMWRRHRRHERTQRSRHPSSRPPIRVDLIDDVGGRRIRLGVPAGAPAVVVDIVSFRPQEPTGAWEGEPLDEPLVLEPGSEAVLSSRLDPDVTTVDVVVAWTAHHESGAVQESRLFRLPPDRDDPPVPARTGAGLPGRVALGLVAVLTGCGLLVVASITAGDGDGAGVPAPTVPPIVATTTSTAPGDPPLTTTTIDAATSSPPSAEPPTTTATTDATTDELATTTSTAAPTTAPPGDGPQVRAEGRIEPCRFGDACLVVGFTIVGFDGSPSGYVCEFDDGSRFEFTFVGDGAETACATGSPTATITVEVEGVRSETIARP